MAMAVVVRLSLETSPDGLNVRRGSLNKNNKNKNLWGVHHLRCQGGTYGHSKYAPGLPEHISLGLPPEKLFDLVHEVFTDENKGFL